MKKYWSIPGPTKDLFGMPCIAFYKYDGSNIRAEWNKKQGWYKFGTRNVLLHESEPYFGRAIQLFKDTYGEVLAKVLTDTYRCQQAEAYCEFFGEDSFGNYHNYDKPFEVMLIDVSIHKRGMVVPREFVKNFGHLKSASVVFDGFFSEEFINDVVENKFGLKEGVVVKGFDPSKKSEQHSLWMAKVKTRWWLEELKKRAVGNAEFQKILQDNEIEQKIKD